MNLVKFVLISWGLTQILVYGKIFDKVRPTEGFLGNLFSCTMCTGFWVGFILWGLSCLTTLIIFDYSIVTGFMLGCISSATSYALCAIITDSGLNFVRNEDETID
tara:strand:+ start:237 stop:551 length:315 start_codon:yes stop_codon:yes gene_type:complete